MKKLIGAALVASLAACSRNAPPAESPKPALQTAVERASLSPECARVIPEQWSYSWPVPVVERGRRSYRIFFYGRDGDPRKGFVFHRAEGDALLSSDGRVLDCRRRGSAPTPIPPDHRHVGVSADDILAREARLFSLAEDVGGLFASGRALTSDERRRVSDFSAAFLDFADPGQAADYRALSPGFWSWVEKNGAAAPRGL